MGGRGAVAIDTSVSTSTSENICNFERDQSDRSEKEEARGPRYKRYSAREVDACPRCMTLINREATRCSRPDNVNYARIIRSG